MMRIIPRLNTMRVLAGVLMLLLLAAVPAGAMAGNAPDHITLTWTDNPQTTQTITWRTAGGTAEGQLRLSPADARQSAKHLTLRALSRSWLTNTGAVNLHTVELTGLTPGAAYYYQVGDGETWSDQYRFRTEAANESFKFLIMGDSQSLDYGVWRATLQQAVQNNPDAAFFVSMGDLVDVGQDYAEWEAWFAAVAGVLEKLPVMPLTGNHECYTPDRRFSQPEYFTAQFSLPQNGPPGLAGQVYSFDYGDVHLIMLDSQASEQARFLPDMLEQQRQWLEADLAATKKRWKLIFIHRPIYGNKPDGIHENLRQAFEPAFDRYQVDVVFTAHDHVYARSGPFYAGEPILPPQRGTLHVATGRTGSKTYGTVTAKPWNNVFINPTEQPIFLSVTVNSDTLQVGVFGQNGELVDSWTIVKPPPDRP